MVRSSRKRHKSPRITRIVPHPRTSVLGFVFGVVAQDQDARVPSRCWVLPHVHENGESHFDIQS